mmetsp:Transcript_35551/g.69740  ORF Transcript_35551/g.69740 Transcript_35551/m.69740 type:complete len:202 (+) Transcript_35551:1030-1635(+)
MSSGRKTQNKRNKICHFFHKAFELLWLFLALLFRVFSFFSSQVSFSPCAILVEKEQQLVLVFFRYPSYVLFSLSCIQAQAPPFTKQSHQWLRFVLFRPSRSRSKVLFGWNSIVCSRLSPTICNSTDHHPITQTNATQNGGLPTKKSCPHHFLSTVSHNNVSFCVYDGTYIKGFSLRLPFFCLVSVLPSLQIAFHAPRKRKN